MLQHYALIITKFNHTCMVYIADRAQKHCTLGISMHADNDILTTRVHFVLESVLYVLHTFTRQYQYHLIFCFMSVFDLH